MADDKGCRITLRLETEFRSFLGELADDLGVGLNDLMNLLLRRAIGPFQVINRGFQRRLGGKPRRLVTLRIDAKLDEVIRRQGGDLNLLITDMLYWALPSFVVECRVFKEYVLTGRYKTLFEKWQKQHPSSTVEEFDNELRRLLAGENSSLAGIETPRTAPPVPCPSPNRRVGVAELDVDAF
jgi:hypothetical protein